MARNGGGLNKTVRMKRSLLAVLWLCSLQGFSQSKDSSLKKNPARNFNNSSKASYKPEILTSGFIDILNSGQVNASARLIRLIIGEPGRLTIPLSIYSGVSSNNFQNQQLPTGSRSNEQLGTNFINPLGGMANVSMEGIIFFKRKQLKITASGLVYHAGIRLLTGYRVGPQNDPSTGRPLNFLNSYSAGGMYFQTGAWETNNSRNIGICWLAGRYIICKSARGQMLNIFPAIRTDGFYHGWSAGWGIEINNLVNIKLLYYKYVKAPEIEGAGSIYQFSFSYSLR